MSGPRPDYSGAIGFTCLLVFLAAVVVGSLAVR